MQDQLSVKNVDLNVIIIQLHSRDDEKFARNNNSQKPCLLDPQIYQRKRLSSRLMPLYFVGAKTPAEREEMNFITTQSESKRQSNQKVSVIEVKLSHSTTAKSSPAYHIAQYNCFEDNKRKKVKMRGTQTLFRESSAHMTPFLPDVSSRINKVETGKVPKLPSILSCNDAPDLFEVERLACEQSQKENFQQQTIEAERKNILQAFEWEHWIGHEEYIQAIQMSRLESVIKMFNKREEEIYATSRERLQRSAAEILQRRDAQLQKNQVEYERELRKLKIKNSRVQRCWRKNNIRPLLSCQSSDFYEAHLRYDANSNRRGFVGEYKEFPVYTNDLKVQVAKMTKLECPFEKYKKLAKPRQRVLMIERNYLSDENLQNIYKTLRSLRRQAVKYKVVPKCLIDKSIRNSSNTE